MNVFVDLRFGDLKKIELPNQILKSAMQFGRLQQLVVYLNGLATMSESSEWQRLGFDYSLANRPDVSMDMLERTVVTAAMPDTVVLVTDSDDRVEVLRRLKRWVGLVVLFAPREVKEQLKRSANLYVPLSQINEPTEVATQDDIYRAIIKFIATTSIPFVGASYLTRTALPQQLRVCTNDEAHQALADAEMDGLIVLYDHIDDNGTTVRAVKLNPDNDYVQTVLEQEGNNDDEYYDEAETEAAD